MSVIFLVLKALQLWDTPYDWAIFLGLYDLDLIVLWVMIIASCELRRLWLHARGR